MKIEILKTIKQILNAKTWKKTSRGYIKPIFGEIRWQTKKKSKQE